jgi:malate dehydrogenase
MKIAIIGAAGSVGSPAAFYIGAEGLADEILMIGGKRQNVLKQHAMDLSTALSEKGVIVKAGDFDDLPGTDIVVNAAGATHTGMIMSRMELLPRNIEIIRNISEKIKQHCPGTIIISATNPVGPLNYLTYLAGQFNRRQLIGYSINDSFRFREALAETYKVKVSQVEGTVIGEHGSSQVLLFSSARIDGQPVNVDKETKKHFYDTVPNIVQKYEAFQAGRTAGWTCAIGIASFVRAIVQDTGETLPCSLVLDGEYNVKDLSMTVPAVIGKEGVREILQWKLASDEQKKLDISVDTLQRAVELVKEKLKALS